MINHVASQKEAFPLAGALCCPSRVDALPVTDCHAQNLTRRFARVRWAFIKPGLHNSLNVAQNLRRRNPYAQISSRRLTYRPCNPLFLPKTCITGNRHNPVIAPKSTAGGRRHIPLIKLNFGESEESDKHQQCLGSEIATNFIGSRWDGCFCNHEKGSTANVEPEMMMFLLHDKNQVVNRVTGSCLDYHIEIFGDPNRVTKRYAVYQSSLGRVVKQQPERELQICRLTQPLAESKGNHPFGSMPRCCNSFLIIRFIQVARDESPSLRISSSNWERSSCAKRIWYWSVFAFPVDIVITNLLLLSRNCNYNVTYNVLQLLNVAKPRSARTLAGPLTKPLYEVTIMADTQSTQIRPKFQYRFMALARTDLHAKPCRLSIEATSEQEARRILTPHFILVFAARLPIAGGMQ